MMMQASLQQQLEMGQQHQSNFPAPPLHPLPRPNPVVNNFEPSPLPRLEQHDQAPDESIHQVTFDYPINSISFKNASDGNVTVAVGSMLMDSAPNKVEIFRLMESTTTSIEQPQQPLTTKRLMKVQEFPHEFPASKIMWEPSMGGDLLATAGECVKIWMVQD